MLWNMKDNLGGIGRNFKKYRSGNWNTERDVLCTTPEVSKGGWEQETLESNFGNTPA